MLAAACCFAGYSALLRRRPAELGGTAFLFATFLAGVVLLLPAQGRQPRRPGRLPPRPGHGPAPAVRRRGLSALAFFAWNKAVALIGATRAGIVYYLQPVCVALLSGRCSANAREDRNCWPGADPRRGRAGRGSRR
ncbi:DMT family transporter [Streptomyces tricolor]|nr:DMT family transporter [Streptomyces tricolor]